MSRIQRISLCGCAALLPAALLGALNLQDPAGAAAPATATAERRSLTLQVNLPGRVESETRRKVILDLEAFQGGFEISEIALRSGPVKAGDPILTLDAEPIDKAIEDADRALAQAQQGFEFAQNEQRILAEANAIRVERAEDSAEDAQHAFEIFDRFTGERIVRSSELRVMQSEYGLADQKEELAQLEKMYEESTLASETKEIVLERNRRQIPISEEYLRFARDDLLIARDFTYPDQKESVEDALRFAMTELAHAQLQTMMAEARKAVEVENARRGLEDAEERAADLKADREKLNVTAPADGLLTPISLVPGDRINAGQLVAEVVDPAALAVTLVAQPGDLRVLAVGDTVEVSFPAYPEVQLNGEVIDIAAIGTPAGEGTSFPVRIALEGSHPLVRVGLNCQIRASETIANAIMVPAKAVHAENGRRVCYVVGRNGQAEAREVVIGPSEGELVQVVRGLAAGDSVLLEQPAEGQ
jgi:RND family efflux transporter MFP subunit